ADVEPELLRRFVQAIKKAGRTRLYMKQTPVVFTYCLCMFAPNSDDDFNHDVRVQCNRYGMIADDLERALRHADLGFLDGETLFGQRFGDIEVGDGTEQTSIHTRFLRNLHGQAVQL